MNSTIMQTLSAVSAATMNARKAAGMPGIGTRVEYGRFQVINTSAGNRGGVIVDELSDWLTSENTIAVLNDIAADKGFRA